MSLYAYESQVRPPLVEGVKDYHQVTEDIVRPIEGQSFPPLVDRLSLTAVACLIFGIVSVTMK